MDIAMVILTDQYTLEKIQLSKISANLMLKAPSKGFTAIEPWKSNASQKILKTFHEFGFQLEL